MPSWPRCTPALPERADTPRAPGLAAHPRPEAVTEREGVRRKGLSTSATISVIFFLSGAAALLFETLWFRLAGLVFGNSVWAASLVLASFMGGLALGNTAA